MNDVTWSLCQYTRVICISNCESLMEVFETQGFNIDNGSGSDDATMLTQRTKKINVNQLSNLKELYIADYYLLHHVFTFSALESLTQLEKLMIRNCKAMNVIVKKDNGEQTTISSKVLCNLPNLAGFFLGMDEFQWPLLES